MSVDIDKLIQKHHLDVQYVKRIGFAMYSFAKAEDHAIWCCDRFDRGFQSSWTRKDWAQAKKLANKLKLWAGQAVSAQTSAADKNNLRELASYCDRFHQLADSGRNNLFHALPVGSGDGQTVLHQHRNTKTYSNTDLEEFITESLDIAHYFIGAFHGYLNDYYP